VLERDIEKYFVKRCKAEGWLCEKFTSPQRRSVPDRLVTMGEGLIIFAELKATGKQPTELQRKDHERREGLG